MTLALRSRAGYGRTVALAAACLPIVTGCADTERAPDVREIASPAGAGSGQPFAAPAPDGRVLLSWLEAAGDVGHALRFAAWDGATWTGPRTIAAASDFFVNWADFPSIHALADGTLAAHWLQRSGPGTYAYDVKLSFSTDGGATWGAPVSPHRDGTQTEHGFVSLFDAPEGGLGAVWLDGRNFADVPELPGGGHGGAADMTLRYARVAPDGTLADEVVLDARTCECCQTSAAVSAGGPVVVYRDRSPDEIRDIAIQRLTSSGWTEPAHVHDDGWEIPGCPVNGPAVDADGPRVVVAWFTAARDTARVYIAFSDDAGRRFGAPIRADEGDPSGRVDVRLRPDGSALLSWLERTGDGAAVRVRRVFPDGRLGRPATVAASSAERASGFPRMAPAGDALLIAWTEPGRPPRVRTAIVRPD